MLFTQFNSGYSTYTYTCKYGRIKYQGKQNVYFITIQRACWVCPYANKILSIFTTIHEYPKDSNISNICNIVIRRCSCSHHIFPTPIACLQSNENLHLATPTSMHLPTRNRTSNKSECVLSSILFIMC